MCPPADRHNGKVPKTVVDRRSNDIGCDARSNAEAFARVPRERFLPMAERQNALDNVPLSIGRGQTNSQPSTVADMLRLLDPQPGETVLDLGSGSGWTSMLLAVLVGPTGRVLGVERHPELVESSRAAIEAVIAESADRETFADVAIHEAVPGALGLPAEAPFDRILVSAGAESLPDQLVDQLAVGATMVIPVAGRCSASSVAALAPTG